MTSGCPASIGFDTAAIGRRRIDWSDRRGGRGSGLQRARCGAAVLLALLIAHTDAQADAYKDAGVGSQSQRRPPPHQWTKFVKVGGQPEPVPAEWVATPEGRFAHSLKIPDPVPKDSGYRWWMSSKDYFKHLCDTEAGEFIYEKVENVEGFLFMRPTGRPSDSDLMDLRALEAPGFEAVFQALGDNVKTRGRFFVSKTRLFDFVEEPINIPSNPSNAYAHASTNIGALRLEDVRIVDHPEAEFGFTWRGLRRTGDRDRRIAGYELLILNLRTNAVVAVLRDFQSAPSNTLASGRTSWIAASYCPESRKKHGRPLLNEAYDFLKSVLNPH